MDTAASWGASYTRESSSVFSSVLELYSDHDRGPLRAIWQEGLGDLCISLFGVHGRKARILQQKGKNQDLGEGREYFYSGLMRTIRNVEHGIAG